MTTSVDLPAPFAHAVSRLRSGPLRHEVTVRETTAPGRLAPYAVAFTGDITRGRDELAAGRFVVLHDPAGQDAWDGTTRVVIFASAPLEPAMGVDPMLPAVGWSWLCEALATADAPHRMLGGTVTRVSSERFGVLAGATEESQVEVRASWSPTEEELTPHLSAFGELLCLAAGLPPGVEGVLPIPATRRARGRGRPTRVRG
jgi:hypothetical protein